MSLLRTLLHLLLAVILVINGAAGVAMAAGMAGHGAPPDAPAALASETHGGCHDSVASAPAEAADHHSSDATDCCEDGRCACACIHHGTVVLASVPPVVALVAVWPPVATLDVTAVPSAPRSPGLRPPIAPIS